MNIFLDMDGTITDLYGVKKWLYYLNQNDITPYQTAKPLVDIEVLNNLLHKVQRCGGKVYIITCASKGASRSYFRQIMKAKRQWLERHRIIYDSFIGLEYGTDKSEYLTQASDLLIDDLLDNLTQWQSKGGAIIDPIRDNLTQALRDMIRKEVVYNEFNTLYRY